MARWVALVQTAMHNVHSLPPEILDLIVEGLTIQDNQSTAASGADAGRWIRAFRNVVHLRVNQHPLALFHGLSPTVKSLRLEFWRAQLSEIFDLMCTFPLLEDFALLVYGYEDDLDGRPTPSTSPRLTGSFELRSVVEISPITRRLLDLPNGLNFMEVALTCAQEKDFRSTTDFVEGCSNTLEFFRFVDFFTAPPTATSFNLSTAVKLKRLVFLCMQPGVRWVTEALQTVESKDLQEITLQSDRRVPVHGFEERVLQQWQDLDRLLVRFWTSHSIHPKITYGIGTGRDMRNYALSMLPELTGRGLIDLVEHSH